MSKITPPSPKNIVKRRDFFLKHLDFATARWEVFNLTNLIIVRDFQQGRIDRIQMINKLRELDHTQGLPQPKSEMIIEDIK